MPSSRPRLSEPSPSYVLLVLGLLVAQTAFVPVATADPTPQSDSSECAPARPAEPDGVPVTVTRGPVENSVTLSVDSTENQSVLDSLWIELPSGASLDAKSGFQKHSPDQQIYTAVENAPSYSLTYTFKQNSTLNGTSANAKLRPYEGEDEWAVAPLPRDYHGVAGFRSPSWVAIGQQTVYFGNYSETIVENGCHRIRLVVPESVDLNRNKTAILDSFLYTDRHLGGKRYDDVSVFVTPENFSTETAGVALNADIVVSGTGETIGETDARSHIWLHEYVHARQSFWPEGDMAWWTEASANYLSIRMGLRSGYLSPERYNEVLSDYGESDTGDAVLANTSTWHNFSTYDRGVLALGQLDATLRNDTNGSVTVVSVFNATDANEPATLAAFTDLLENQTGDDHDEWAANYVTGTTTGELRMKADTPTDYTVGIVAALLLLVAVVYFERRDNDSEESETE